MLRRKTAEDYSFGAIDRATRPRTYSGFSRTPREGARKLCPDTELKTGGYKNILPLSGIPGTDMSRASPSNPCYPSEEDRRGDHRISQSRGDSGLIRRSCPEFRSRIAGPCDASSG